MAKFILLLIATVIIQAAIASPRFTRASKKRHFQIQAVSTQVEQAGNDAVNAVQDYQTDSNLGQRSLALQANEYAHQIQQAVYRLNKAIQVNPSGDNQQQLKEVSRQLSDAAHAVQQAVNSDSAQLKNQLKEAVKTVVAQVQKLSQAVQQAQNDPQQVVANNQVRDVLDAILATVHKVEVHAQQQKQKSPQEIKKQVETVTGQVTGLINNITSSDPQVVEELAIQVKGVARNIGLSRVELENWAHDNREQSNAVAVVREVTQKLRDLEVDLNQVASGQGADGQLDLKILKEKLVESFLQGAAQLQKLMQIQPSAEQQNQVGEPLSQVVGNILVQAFASSKTLFTQLQLIVQSQAQSS